jgi:hypothetical protein
VGQELAAARGGAPGRVLVGGLAALVVVGVVAAWWVRRDCATIWDEAVNLGMGKHLASGGRVGLTELLRPPGLPALAGIAWRLGLDPIAAGRALAATSTLGTIFFAWRLAQPQVERRLALAVASTFTIAPVVYLWHVATLAHLPASCLALASLGAYRAGRPTGAGALAFAACAVRFVFGLFVACFVVLALAEAHRRRELRRVGRLAIGFALAALPWLAYNVATSGDDVGWLAAQLRPLAAGSEHIAGDAWRGGRAWADATFYLRALVTEGWVGLAAVLAVPWIGARAVPVEQRIAIASAVALLAFYTAISNHQARFLLDVLGFATVAAALVIGRIARSPRALPIALAAALVGQGAVLVRVARRPAWSEPPPSPYQRWFGAGAGRTILTVDPTFVAYSDDRFLPFYHFGTQRPLEVWARHRDEVAYVAFTPEGLGCRSEACARDVRAIGDELAAWPVAVVLDVDGRPLTVYRRPGFTPP